MRVPVRSWFLCLLLSHPGLVRKLDDQVARLEQEEEAAYAKHRRLRKQRKLLEKRRAEMLRRGFSTLEEMEAEDREEGEQKERERIEKEALQLAAASSSSAADPLDLSWWTGALSPSFVVDPGSGDGTVPPSGNTS
jgi:hypothetical protein